jgi:predicted Zn-dependent protease
LPLLMLPFLAVAQEKGASDTVLETMKSELNRSLTALKEQPVPPYFVSYQLTDNRAINVQSSFGALTQSNDQRTRLLDIDLRVGDYKLDSTHGGRPGTVAAGAIPIEDDPGALAVSLWIETDRQFKEALQLYEAVKTNQDIKLAAEDKSPDFSAAAADKYLEPLAPFSFDRPAWEEKVRKYGRGFRGHPDILSAEVSAIGEIETRRYVSTDGAEIRMSMPFYRLLISASIRAADGEVMGLNRTFMSFHPGGLPGDEEVLRTVSQMVDMLLALQKAPVGEPYTGPAILSGRSSAVFFHEIFGHRVEGARLKDENDAQTFKKKINQPVLPDFLSVYSDPTLQSFRGADLVGYYPYDDEGVKARRVTVVDKGVFKTFLMSRSPVDGFDQSNGHGRRQQGYAVAARQSNLLVEASKTVARAELKKMLIESIQAANKPYGLLFDDIEGGFTFTSRQLPNSFSVMPTVIYRVYADGREELVRGLNLIGTPLIAFSKIVAADDDPEVFNGVCGAESGWVPVSAVAPGLLLAQIEVQRKEKSQERPPILPAPVAGDERSPR